LLLDGIEVRQYRGDIIRFKKEFRHIGMTDRKPLRERFGQLVNRVFAGQGAKRRRGSMRAFPGTGNGLAVRASGIQQLFSTPFEVRLCCSSKAISNNTFETKALGSRSEHFLDYCG
jgi:hypothetical protein